MSKPPLPRPRSSAAVLTTTSSPGSTGPVSGSYESAARWRPPTSTVISAAGPLRSTDTTLPRRGVADDAERDVEHRLERVHGHRLVRLVGATRAVGDVQALEPARLERVGVAPAARGDEARLDPGLLERARGDRHARGALREPEAAEQLLYVDLHVARAVCRGLGHRVDDLARHCGGALVVDRAGLAL